MIGFDIGGTKCAVSVGTEHDGILDIKEKRIIEIIINIIYQKLTFKLFFMSVIDLLVDEMSGFIWEYRGSNWLAILIVLDRPVIIFKRDKLLFIETPLYYMFVITNK